MARTGESYMVARLKVIEEHRSKAGSPPQQDRAADVQMAGLRAGIAQFERNIRAAKTADVQMAGLRAGIAQFERNIRAAKTADVQMAGLRAGIAQFERNIRAAKLGPRAASRPGPSSR